MITHSMEETILLGEKLGRLLCQGDTVILKGDLASGKTTFTKGIGKALNIAQVINSPTFTILQIYESGRMPLYHFDVYRIEDPYEMEEVGFDDFIYGEGVSVIEWPGQIYELFPDIYIKIRISRDYTRGDDYRLIEIEHIG